MSFSSRKTNRTSFLAVKPNPIAIGRLSAYVSVGLTAGSITGAPGVTLETPDGRTYAVVREAE